MNTILKIAVFAVAPYLQAQAQLLAEQLKLPFVIAMPANCDYLLVLTPNYLGLQKTGSKFSPLHIDFLAGEMLYRQRHASLNKEALARALGLKKKAHTYIIDATAGLAGDSFILAVLGFAVTALERSPIVYSLVKDAMERAKGNAQFAPVMDRLQLIQADAIFWLQSLKKHEQPDIIYLDPMFPLRKKSALPRRKMLILQELVGEDVDADELIATALACATQRVVIKRPRLAAIIAARVAPSFAVIGSSSRFDVYLL